MQRTQYLIWVHNVVKESLVMHFLGHFQSLTPRLGQSFSNHPIDSFASDKASFVPVDAQSQDFVVKPQAHIFRCNSTIVFFLPYTVVNAVFHFHMVHHLHCYFVDVLQIGLPIMNATTDAHCICALHGVCNLPQKCCNCKVTAFTFDTDTYFLLFSFGTGNLNK